MKKLKYLVILLFLFSIFSCVPASRVKSSPADCPLYKDIEWLMLNSEKKALKVAKTEVEQEQIIKRFWQARDPDHSTAVNEFRKIYERRIEAAKRDYSDLEDPRRYIFLLFGPPTFRRPFSNQQITIFDFPIRINTGDGEIWEYSSSSGKGLFQVIFSKINLHSLELVRNRYFQDQKADFIINLTQNDYEILYLGAKRYSSIAEFFRDFFSGVGSVRSTWDIVGSQKSPILSRAKEFYKNSQPKVRKKRYKSLLKVSVLIDPFGFWFGESRIHIWCTFDKDSLVRKKDDEYKADISLFWELRGQSGRRVAYYQQDSIKYKLAKRRSYIYHFWGSAPPGKYKLVLEIGENLSKKYKKVETDITIWPRTKSKLEAEIIAGKIFRKKQNWIKEKDFNPFSIKGSQFLPLSVLKPRYFIDEYYFKEEDEVAVFFNVSGFKRDHYGNPYLNLGIVFTDNQLRAFPYRFRPIRKAKNGIVGSFILVVKISEFIKGFKADPGYYKIILSISDMIANKFGTITYSDSERRSYQVLIVK